MGRTIAIIQARVSSTRLLQKVLLPIGNHPLLWHVVHRVQQAQTLDAMIVATGDIEANDPIEALCHAEGWQCYRGSEDDVLARFYGAACLVDAQAIVRITGDCPLHSGEEIDRVMNYLWCWRLHYATNAHPPSLPDGVDCEVMTMGALEKVHHRAVIASDREHVTPWLRRNLPTYRWGSVDHTPDLSRWRLCVDEQADLDVMRAVFDALGEDCTWQQVVKWLKEHPEVAALNAHLSRNASYERQAKEEQDV